VLQETLNGGEVTGKIFPIIQFVLRDLRTDFESNTVLVESCRANFIGNTVKVETVFFFGLVPCVEGLDARSQTLRGELVQELLPER
jgi:hypothetical protein